MALPASSIGSRCPPISCAASAHGTLIYPTRASGSITPIGSALRPRAFCPDSSDAPTQRRRTRRSSEPLRASGHLLPPPPLLLATQLPRPTPRSLSLGS